MIKIVQLFDQMPKKTWVARNPVMQTCLQIWTCTSLICSSITNAYWRKGGIHERAACAPPPPKKSSRINAQEDGGIMGIASVIRLLINGHVECCNLDAERGHMHKVGWDVFEKLNITCNVKTHFHYSNCHLLKTLVSSLMF